MAVKIEHKDIGDVWVPQATFTVAGTPTDPTNITVKKMDAAGVITTLGPVSGGTGGGGIVRVSAGIFNTLIPLTASGHWHAEFIGDGAAAGTEWHTAIADPSPFASNYGLSSQALVTMNEARDWLQQPNQDAPENLELVRLINDVSDRFHQEAQREFKPRVTNPSARTFEVTFRPYQAHYVDGTYMGTLGGGSVLKVGDLTSFTAADVIDYDWTTVLTPTIPLTSIESLPANRAAWEPIRELRFHSSVVNLAPGRRIRVTGTWGFPAVPGNVRQAVLDAIAAIRDRDVEHYRQDIGVGTSIEGGGGTTIMLAGGGQRMLSMPPTSLAVAWAYRDVHVG
jgi:hypothetical protein